MAKIQNTVNISILSMTHKLLKDFEEIKNKSSIPERSSHWQMLRETFSGWNIENSSSGDLETNIEYFIHWNSLDTSARSKLVSLAEKRMSDNY